MTMTDVRTNIVVDDELIEEAMRIYNVRTRREIVDMALRYLVMSDERRKILELEGMGWELDINDLRAASLPEDPFGSRSESDDDRR
ncbi:type II toxin-antitoxin system VapB family antitoxin [Frankia sp. Cr2]|uniref:type II toxin-antitoxin system VapB family antitoxin n=1 Tax=Frankia sp. Cr2 TaxID=3073932 RepID=UPI002AD2768A|nr:type II toxin-antitoxin system VapB family antitoxin [Frankia sp. Cr2]